MPLKWYTLAWCIGLMTLLLMTFLQRGLITKPSALRPERAIIVGGGIAGLAAAAVLQSSGAEVTLLEAQERLGGRIQTDRSVGVPVELGAVWIHHAQHNIVTELADQFSCPRFVTENRRLALYDERGNRIADKEVQQAYLTLTKVLMPAALRRRSKLEGRADESLAELLQRTLAALLRGRSAGGSRVSRGDGGGGAPSSLPRTASWRWTPVQLRILSYLLYRHVAQVKRRIHASHPASCIHSLLTSHLPPPPPCPRSRHVWAQDHACDLSESSAREYDTDYYGGLGSDELLPGGYDCIVRGLASSLRRGSGAGGRRRRVAMEMGRVVTRVQWAKKGEPSPAAAVQVATSDGRVYVADRVIVTVPLGVLKASGDAAGSGTPAMAAAYAAPPQPTGAVHFVPPLPPSTRRAVRRLGFGSAHHVALRFPSAFWPRDAHFIGIMGGGAASGGGTSGGRGNGTAGAAAPSLIALAPGGGGGGGGGGDERGSPPLEFLNVNRYHHSAPVLLLISTGTTASVLGNLTDADAVSWVLHRLRRAFPHAPAPSASLVHGASSSAASYSFSSSTTAGGGGEAFQRGAWSHLRVGGGLAAHAALGRASLGGGRLYFAGEHASELHPGTVRRIGRIGRRPPPFASCILPLLLPRAYSAHVPGHVLVPRAVAPQPTPALPTCVAVRRYMGHCLAAATRRIACWRRPRPSGGTTAGLRMLGCGMASGAAQVTPRRRQGTCGRTASGSCDFSASRMRMMTRARMMRAYSSGTATPKTTRSGGVCHWLARRLRLKLSEA